MEARDKHHLNIDLANRLIAIITRLYETVKKVEGRLPSFGMSQPMDELFWALVRAQKSVEESIDPVSGTGNYEGRLRFIYGWAEKAFVFLDREVELYLRESPSRFRARVLALRTAPRTAEKYFPALMADVDGYLRIVRGHRLNADFAMREFDSLDGRIKIAESLAKAELIDSAARNLNKTLTPKPSKRTKARRYVTRPRTRKDERKSKKGKKEQVAKVA